MGELRTETADGIAVLTLDVPAKRNALTMALRMALRDALGRLDADPDCRGVVLTGAGDAFCSGGDVEGMGGDGAAERLGVLHDVVRLVACGGTPVVAAVRGPAYGGGFSLAMAADAVVADPTARFCASFGRIGLMPDMGLMWSLPGRVGEAKARRIALEGREIEAAGAHRLGLVDEMAADGQHVAAARALAASLGVGPVGAVKALARPGLEAMLAAEMATQPELMAGKEHRTAREAFLARRRARDGDNDPRGGREGGRRWTG